MKIEKIIDGSKITFAFDGCLDTESAPLLEEEVNGVEKTDKLVFDFKNLEYISSSGLRQIISSYKKSLAEDFSFEIINVNNEVMSVFTMTGLADKLNIK